MEQITAAQFDDLFAAYLPLRLSAFENLKIVAGVLAANGCEFEAYEIKAQLESNSDTQAAQLIYGVKWLQQWISCGRTNGYQQPILLIEDAALIELATAVKITVPILSLQQISFMCVETAHFDHC
ncbi:hypothetical protein [Shewanella sp. UCD-KL21]|uniref:hypothetical protein n=1 Tax=Shewanella sp. UCD-KL21 TaxID=1917164 RepID=UPI000970C130|nr:hypothetical protein [Shewanella sp. UCD-KL21]